MTINKFDALVGRLRRQMVASYHRSQGLMAEWSKEVARYERLLARIDELEANAPPRSVRERKAKGGRP